MIFYLILLIKPYVHSIEIKRKLYNLRIMEEQNPRMQKRAFSLQISPPKFNYGKNINKLVLIYISFRLKTLI